MIAYEDNRNVCIVPPTEGFAGQDELLIITNCIKKEFPDTYEQLRKDKTTIMGCPTENENLDYRDKINTLLSIKEFSSIKVAVTEKTCDKCLHDSVRKAVAESGKKLPVFYVFIDNDGTIKQG